MKAHHKQNRVFGKFLLAALILLACGCQIHFAAPKDGTFPMLIAETYFQTPDGRALPLAQYRAAKPKGIIVALHGFNDYSNAFANPAPFWRDKGYSVFAYDQRGFGKNKDAGLWAGAETLAQDARHMIETLHRDYPGLPIYLLGDSMGGAVSILASADNPPLGLSGMILIAPAVWGRAAMNPFQVMALWAATHVAPWLHLSGKHLDLQPSDNIPMLRQLAADPLVLKNARTETLYGMTDLMDEALEQSANIHLPTLVLYGGNDEIIPPAAMRAMLKRLPENAAWQIAYYKDGYHMLLRDLDGGKYWRDILDWIEKRPLSSAPHIIHALDMDSVRF